MLYLCVFNHANYPVVKDVQDKLFNTWVKTVLASLDFASFLFDALRQLCFNGLLSYEPAKIAPSMSYSLYLGGMGELHVHQIPAIPYGD